MDNFFALIVGVGGEGFDETVKDAQAIRDVLTTQGAYNSTNTFFLTESRSTKFNIINAFDEIINKCEETEDSTVFIYYSGHGQRYPSANNGFDYYLRTYGADENSREETMLNGDIFSEKVDKIKANRVLVMLDCCYAGGIKKLKIKGGEEIKYSNRALQEKLISGEGRVFVSSCEDDETSVILPGSQNSLFTEVVLEVLDGLFSQNREYVSVLDLIYHVLCDVPNRIEPYNHKQNPILTEAKNLTHKYYICKNGKRKQNGSPIETNLQWLNIDKVEEPVNVSDIEDLSNDDKYVIDEFINKMNFENAIQPLFKLNLVNNIGVSNLKKVNKILHTIKIDKAQPIESIDVESLLSRVDEEVDTQKKLEFIQEYKYKVLP